MTGRAERTDDPAVRRAARRQLRRVDPVMRRIIGPGDLSPGRSPGGLPALVQSIISQQLAAKAAASILGRLRMRVGGAWSARGLLELDDAAFRASGISRQKMAALRDLATKEEQGLLRLHGLGRLDDERVVERLIQVRGIGRWTAEMYLVFVLRRPDVLSVGDLGLQSAAQRLYGLRARPSPQRFRRLALPWRPYRSVASWYLWAALGGWDSQTAQRAADLIAQRRTRRR
jgi:DNA-3-methyladenine glycosylase II